MIESFSFPLLLVNKSAGRFAMLAQPLSDMLDNLLTASPFSRPSSKPFRIYSSSFV